MADMHVLKGAVNPNDVIQVSYQYIVHFPTAADAALKARAVLDPAVSQFVSALGDPLDGLITQVELDSIRAGDVVEQVANVNYNTTEPKNSYLQRTRDGWNAELPVAQDKFAKEYDFYGQEVDANP